jgi:prepilin-type processing-associated H-X9-DG protein
MARFYHNGAESVSFADGHVESRKWRDRRTTPPMLKGKQLANLYGFNIVKDNPDAVWIVERATSPASDRR